MTWLRRVNLAFAVIAMLAPAVHLLEFFNKLALDGPLWLAVQQSLYRGWGPLLGGPSEIGALGTTLALLALRRRPRTRNPTLVAAIAYAGMLTVFFVFNAPVNVAVSHWTASTLPTDWSAYRLRWEVGHALAALFSAIGLAALVRCSLIEARDRYARQD